MRTALMTIAAAASALAFAAPASAQYFPAPGHVVPGYVVPRYVAPGYSYGYRASYGQVRYLQARIDQLQWRINQLDRRNILSGREARQLRRDAWELERRLRVASRYGLHPAERYQVEARLARLERRLWRDANDGRRWAYYAPRW